MFSNFVLDYFFRRSLFKLEDLELLHLPSLKYILSHLNLKDAPLQVVNDVFDFYICIFRFWA